MRSLGRVTWSVVLAGLLVSGSGGATEPRQSGGRTSGRLAITKLRQLDKGTVGRAVIAASRTLRLGHSESRGWDGSAYDLHVPTRAEVEGTDGKGVHVRLWYEVRSHNSYRGTEPVVRRYERTMVFTSSADLKAILEAAAKEPKLEW